MGVTPETGTPGPPLSSLRVAGGFVFLSGQGGFDADHNLVDGGVAAATARIFHNVARLLKSAGASLDDVVSCLVHLADLNDYAALNDEYEALPRRETGADDRACRPRRRDARRDHGGRETALSEVSCGQKTVAELVAERCVETGRTVVVADVDDVAFTLRPPARRAELSATAQGARSPCRPVDAVEGRCGRRPRADLRQGRARSPLPTTTRWRDPVPGAHRRAPADARWP